MNSSTFESQTARWKLRSNPQSTGALDLNNGLALPDFVRAVLSSRGISSQIQIEKWLNPKLKDLRDPNKLRGMKESVDRLIHAHQNNEKLCIYADFDLDGTAGLALLYTALKEHFGFKHVQYYQPHRLSEGYGFHPHAVEDLKAQDVRLIVTVDVGITSLAACELAQKLSIDVIITDHHLPGPSLPSAFTIVNPNTRECDSNLGMLCGAGVAFYLVMALKREMEKRELLSHNVDLKSLLDFFVIGTLTDMVPLIEENRVLSKHGLSVFSRTQRPGLKALVQRLNMSDREITGSDLAIRITPKLNALSRMESGVRPIEILLEKNAANASSLVESALKVNDERLTHQQSSFELAVQKVQALGPVKDFIFIESKEFHRGIVGLIATKLAQEFNVPTFVGATNAEGVVVGSARMPKDSFGSLLDILGSAKGLLSRFGGHAAAAGFEYQIAQFDGICSSFEHYFRDRPSNPEPVSMIYDYELTLQDVNASNLKWLDSLGPYGVGFEIPVFMIRCLKIKTLIPLRGGHIKLVLRPHDHEVQPQETECLLFSPRQLQTELCEIAFKNQSPVDVLTEIQWNYFNGKKSVQILCRELRLSE